MTKLTNEEAIREVIKAAVELAIVRHSLTDEDEAERDDFDMEFVTADTANAAFGIDTCVEEPIPEVAEILKRMAEGAAGEASRNAEALFVMGDCYKCPACKMPLIGTPEGHLPNCIVRETTETNLNNAGWISPYESGSASTAGPRCPICKSTDLTLYVHEGEVYMHCSDTQVHGAIPLETGEDLKQLFAAAPAEDANRISKVLKQVESELSALSGTCYIEGTDEKPPVTEFTSKVEFAKWMYAQIRIVMRQM